MPGYDAETLEPQRADLYCPECKLLLRDAIQTNKGIRLCKSCFEQTREYSSHTSHKSEITIKKKYYSDKAVQREVFQLIVLCSYSIYGCPWQGQLQHFEGHCRNCKYRPVRCPNLGCSELMPTETLDTHVMVDCPFRKVFCNHCRKETAANWLEGHLNWCPRVPVECEKCSERVARDVLKEHQQRDCPYVECPVPRCGAILHSNGAEKKPSTIANHLTNPLTLFRHLVALFTYVGDGKANGDKAGVSDARVLQASYDVSASVDPKSEVNSKKVEDSKPIIPEATRSLEDFRSTFLRCVMGKITTTLAETLKPLVMHLCSQPSSEVQFVWMKREPVDDASNRSECPEISNILHHIKKKHHLGKYADIFGYWKERELCRDIDKLLRHIHNFKKTTSVSSQWKQICVFLADATGFLIEIEMGLLLNNEYKLAGDMDEKIDEMNKMKTEFGLFCVSAFT